MNLWLVLILALISQETATCTIAFTLAIQNHLPLWPIHVLWAMITIGDMYLGYALGSFIQSHAAHSRIIGKIDTVVGKLRRPLGRYGDSVVLIVLALLTFPYLITFIAPWLRTRMRTSFIFVFIGNSVWYALLWTAIIGTNAFLSGPEAVAFVIVVVLVLFFLLRRTPMVKEFQ